MRHVPNEYKRLTISGVFAIISVSQLRGCGAMSAPFQQTIASAFWLESRPPPPVLERG